MKQNSAEEKDIDTVINYEYEKLKSIEFPKDGIEKSIKNSTEILADLGYDVTGCMNNSIVKTNDAKKIIKLSNWEDLCSKAYESVGDGKTLESLFTEEELKENKELLNNIGKGFNRIHKLDKYDVMIAVVAGLLSAMVDILLVGIPNKTTNGLKAGPLSNYIRDAFDKKFPKDEMEKLANSKVSKVPYDAQDNRNTLIDVEGLSAYYHRLLSLGHDPVLGLIFGVYDILNGKMTTIDKSGKLVSQIMDVYADRKEINIFNAISKQIIHFKSDVTTSMGLPAPFMSLFNFCQFGSIGEEEQTIAQIVQGMYYEGYDFIHFCSMSVPVMINEIIVRLGYAIKRIKEGNLVKDSIPFSLDRDKRPKLATMLFISQSIATAVNAGKIYFTQNPLSINYPQWIMFAKYSFIQLKWNIIDKPEKRLDYIQDKLDIEVNDMYKLIDDTWYNFSKDAIIIDK